MGFLSIGIITVSDSCSEGTAVDTSGPRLRELATRAYGADSSFELIIIPDDQSQIECTLSYFIDVLHLNVVITTGGTGFSSRDVTPEATRNVIEKEAPQLSLAMALTSLEKTQFAALSRAVCGIRKQSLVINMPGSKKAVEECFAAIADIIPHAVQTIVGANEEVKLTHKEIQKCSRPQNGTVDSTSTAMPVHVCPHKTGTGGPDDRNSTFPMVDVKVALQMVFDHLTDCRSFEAVESTVNIPPFRASIKDGYAVKAAGGTGPKKVVDYMAAGDPILDLVFADDECVKINTGAAVPTHADAIVQVEDTVLLSEVLGVEQIVDIRVQPVKNTDIRPIGSDLAVGSRLFRSETYPGHVAYKSLLASVGVDVKTTPHDNVNVCIISTGDELTAPGQSLAPGRIFDSNSTMLKALLNEHGFHNITSHVVKDDFESLRDVVAGSLSNKFIICSGGVSMGDKDFLKDVLEKMEFTTHFGRVNMKPGKPMTFATNNDGNCVFGLPGNPVSAFVTFHLFVLPAIRKYSGYSSDKISLPTLKVELLSDSVVLDARPEYVRAKIISKQGKLYAEVITNQISSRLQSIEEADALLLLPMYAEAKPKAMKGAILDAYILKPFFISSYE